MHTRFILINPSHAGNVGAVARAMKVMGFDDLVLLQPRWPDVLTRPEALERASGADDVLRRARIVHSWEEAVAGIQHLCATAMTARDFGPPTTEPRPHFATLAQWAQGMQSSPAWAGRTDTYPAAVQSSTAHPAHTPPYGADVMQMQASDHGPLAVGHTGDYPATVHDYQAHTAHTPLHGMSAMPEMSALPEMSMEGAGRRLATAEVQGDYPSVVHHCSAQTAYTPLHGTMLRSVGLVFGCERYGMSNQDVYRCHSCLRIPTSPAYGSLNLAAAVQVLAYEWRLALGGFAPGASDAVSGDAPVDAPVDASHGRSGQPRSTGRAADALADAAAVEGVLAHWQQVLEHTGYLNPASPKKLIPRLRRLLFRAALREEEVHILRGMARQIEKSTHPPTSQRPGSSD